MISTDAFNSYQNATGGVFDQDTQLLKITSAQYANLKSIFVHVNGVCVLSWIGYMTVWSNDISSFFTRSHSN